MEDEFEAGGLWVEDGFEAGGLWVEDEFEVFRATRCAPSPRIARAHNSPRYRTQVNLMRSSHREDVRKALTVPEPHEQAMQLHGPQRVRGAGWTNRS